MAPAPAPAPACSAATSAAPPPKPKPGGGFRGLAELPDRPGRTVPDGKEKDAEREEEPDRVEDTDGRRGLPELEPEPECPE